MPDRLRRAHGGRRRAQSGTGRSGRPRGRRRGRGNRTQRDPGAAPPGKESIARQFGATHFIDAREGRTTEAIQDVTRGGADWVFECVGQKQIIEEAIGYLDWAGSLVILGVTPFGTAIDFLPENLFLDRSILGCRYGSSRPQHDIPRFAELYLSGKFLLDELVTQVYPMDAIHEVIEDMEAGRLARGVLEMPGGGA